MKIGQQTIGPYTLGRCLGEGPLGRVFEAAGAKAPGTQARVAVKWIHPAVAQRPGIADRLRVHAVSPPRLDHPAMHGPLSILCQDGEFAFVTDLLECEPFDLRIARQGVWPARRVIGPFAQLLEAFELAHRRSFIHADIRPGNVVILPDNSFRVLDYYNARVFGFSPSTEDLLGHSQYRSPEQAAGRPLDALSDIYSLGIVLRELTAGHAGLQDVIRTATHQDRARRFQDVAQFRKALLDLPLEEPARPMVAVPPVQIPPPAAAAKARVNPRLAVGLAAAAALSAVTWMVLPTGRVKNTSAASGNAPSSQTSPPPKQAAAQPADAAEHDSGDQEPEPRTFVPPPPLVRASLPGPAYIPPPVLVAESQVPQAVPLPVSDIPAMPPPVRASPPDVVPKAQISQAVPLPVSDIPATATPAPAIAGPVRVPAEVQRARLRTGAPPIYPELARQRHIWGKVRLEVLISADGRVQSVRLLAGHAILAEAATRAVQTWLYQPAVVNSRPVPISTEVEIVFTEPSQRD